MAEVVAHQLLDALPRLGARIAKHLGGALLQLVAQHVLVAPALEVQRRAHAQQEILRIVEPRGVRRAAAQQQRIGEQRNRARRGQVAQRARRFLHVGFELVQRRVELRVALVDQREQRAQDERVRLGLVKHRAEPLEHRARARDRTRVEQRQQELRIVGLEPLKILDVAHLVTDDDAEIPQRVEKRVDEPLFGGADAAAEEQQQIDIRVEAEVPAAVAAERDDGDRTVIRDPRR